MNKEEGLPDPGASQDAQTSLANAGAEPSAAMAEACRIIGDASAPKPLLALAKAYVHLVNEKARG